jgi:DNA-binding MarR family transcriptional regulator
MRATVETPCVCTTVRMTARTITRLYDGALAAAGLRSTGYAILARLDSDGPLTIGELATRLALERTTCSRETAALVEQGLLVVSGAADRRRRVVALSRAGRKRVALARPRWEAVQAEVTDAFGPAQTARLLRALRRLLDTGQDLAAGEGT